MGVVMVNSHVRRRARHVALLLLTWYLLMPGAGDPALAGGAATPAAAAAAVDTAGLTVLGKNVLIRPNGTQRALTLPKGVDAVDASEVPAGWIVEAQSAAERTLWYFGPTGAGKRIGYVLGNWDVTRDGRILVASAFTAAATKTVKPVVTAIDLPSLRTRAQQRYAGGVAPLVVGVTADQVLLRQAQREAKATPAAVWQLSTNRLRATTVPAWYWSFGGTATVLRRVDRLDAAKKVVGACVDAVDGSGASIPTGLTGTCVAAAANVRNGLLSPDGKYAVLLSAPAAATSKASPSTLVVRTADLHAGRWRPVALGAGRFVQFWDSPTSMIVAVVAGEKITMQRCDTAAKCTALRLPAAAGTGAAILVPRYGR
jgi:hypothetical protein